MATGVAFGRPSTVLYQPGGYTQVDASALELAGAFSRNTVCVLGQALGGEPMRIYAFNDAFQAQQVFGGGTPLATAIAGAFRGGVNGGAPIVLGVRVDNAGQASGVLNAINGTSVKGTLKDFGGYGNTYSVTFGNGFAVIEGKTLDGQDYFQRISDPSFSNLVRRINRDSPVDVEITAGGTKAAQTLTLATSPDNGLAQIDDDGGQVTTEAYLYQFPASLYQDSLRSFVASFSAAHTISAGDSITVSSSLPASLEGTYTVTDAIAAYTLSLTNAAITLTAYGSDIYRITLQGAEVWGHDSDQGLIGSVFTIAAGPYAGTYQVVHYEWDGTGLDQIRTVRRVDDVAVLAEGTYTGDLAFWTAIQLPRVQPATEAIESQLPANGVLARGGQFITVTLEDPNDTQGAIAVFYATQPGDTIEGVGNKLVSLIAESADWQGKAVASAIYNGGTYTSTLSIVADDPGILGNDYKVGILVNVQSTLLVASNGLTLAGGVDPEPPKDGVGNTTGALILQSGFDSVPTLQRWLDGLEAVQYQPLRCLVAAGTDNAGVHAAFADHVREMSGTPKRRERICVLGPGLGWSIQEVKDRAETFNNERVMFAWPGLQTPDFQTGIARMYPSSWLTTGLIAGMLAAEGNGISDPITNTFLTNITATEVDVESGSIELDELIQSGVLVINKEPTLVRNSRGYRVVRAITTQRSSNTFESISVVNQSDFIAQVIRDMEETIFVGRALEPVTLELVRTQINIVLQRYTQEGVIYGFDPARTRASLNRDNRSAVDTSYVIYPSPALEFVLNNQLLFPVPSEG